MVNNLLFWPTETADNKLMTHKSTVTSHIWLLERRLLTSTDMFRTLQGENATVTEVVYLQTWNFDTIREKVLKTYLASI